MEVSMGSARSRGPSRALFVLAILLGSFLLFLVQPLVARLALPRLGGAPNVWNSAMLVYQALLLGGYAYAHVLQRWPVRRQASIHLALLALAALTLPISLADLAPSKPGWEVVWVPALLALTIGPVFFLVAAQAPLMQRWYSADARAGEPYALYAASNLGSFTGLLCYPLVLEPELSLHAQSLVWSAGYALLFLLVALTAWARWNSSSHPAAAMESSGVSEASGSDEKIGWQRIAMWLALAAVPSGLMLSTTTYITTDIFAMPLLWVIPLGLYLLSFVPAFSVDRRIARILTLLAPLILLLNGGMMAVSQGSSGPASALGAVLLLFVVAVALHGRMYDDRPSPSKLTLFYLVMSAGGVLGGIFTALFAPVVFDWAWEHPLLVLAAALLVPLGDLPGFLKRLLPTERRQLAFATLLLLAAIGFGAMLLLAKAEGHSWAVVAASFMIVMCGLLARQMRWAYLAVLLVMLLAQGGILTMAVSADGARSRSYFGIYTVRDDLKKGIRTLTHGTTAHGSQYLAPEKRRVPLSYYGPTSGVGIALRHAPRFYGAASRVGIVGLGSGTLACYRQPDQVYTFFEIDPLILDYSLTRKFTFLPDCAPGAVTHLGDARLELEKLPGASFDALVIDAFSSDAIPLHLLTLEALEGYKRTLRPNGILLLHISNRYIDLEPVLAASAKERGLSAAIRMDTVDPGQANYSSSWVILAPDDKTLQAFTQSEADLPWQPLGAPAENVWTDDYAATLPHIRWNNLLRSN